MKTKEELKEYKREYNRCIYAKTQKSMKASENHKYKPVIKVETEVD